MTLNQLRYFCTAGRNHSVTKAAQELYVTQPTISLAIRDLENEFQVSLFFRNGNHLELTPEGELFYKRASYILQCSADLISEFQKLNLNRPPLRIGIPPMLSTIFLPDLLNYFQEAYPGIPVELDEYGSMRAADLVLSEHLDLAIVNMEIYNIDKFNNCLLSADHLVYCVSSEHPLADQTVIKMGDFEKENILLFNSDSVQIQLLKERFDRLKIHPHVVMRSSQIYSTLKFIRQGNCGCFLFSDMLGQFPELKALLLDPPLNIQIGIIWKKGRYISSEMRKFISFAQRAYIPSSKI